MDQETKDRIFQNIERLDSNLSTLKPAEAESILMSVLTPLLTEEGYTLTQTAARSDAGLDFIAQRLRTASYDSNSIGIEYKHYTKQSVAVNAVEQVLGAVVMRGFDRAMLITNSRFTHAAREIVRRTLPLRLDLIDIDALKAWVARIEIESKIDQLEVEQILKVVSRRFAQLIAEEPRNLDKLEWRDLERTLAEVFEGLGFSVELTPGSKDGGKDIILECVISGLQHSYVVEIKHWRSGNRVGQSTVSDFLNVIVRERRKGGLFLSTYGYCDNAFEMLSEIQRQQLRFGNEEKIVSLYRTYVKATSGIWSPPQL